MLFYVLLLASSAMCEETVNFMQTQSAMVAELSLQGKMSDCLLRSYCLVGAHATKSGTIAEGIADSYAVFKAVMNTVEEAESLVNINKLKTSYELGLKTLNNELCSNMFRCELEENFELPETRVKVPECKNIGAVCPGASIGCALCGMFLPGTCGTVCPMAGIFCGASGYMCMLGGK